LEDSSTLSNTHSPIAPVPSDITTRSFKKSLNGQQTDTTEVSQSHRNKPTMSERGRGGGSRGRSSGM